VLVDHTDPSGERLLGAVRVQRLPIDQHASGARLEVPGHHFEGGRFASAVFADQRVDPPRLDVHAHIAYRDDVAEAA